MPSLLVVSTFRYLLNNFVEDVNLPHNKDLEILNITKDECISNKDHKMQLRKSALTYKLLN